MATEKWLAGAGVGLTWTNAFNAADINSLANGNAILSGISIANGGATLDMFCDVSFSLGSVTTTGTPFLGLYMYPLNEDGTTYGDGKFGTAAAGPPSANYYLGYAGLPVGTQVLTGSFKAPGGGPFILPPGTFKFVLYSSAGVSLAGSANAILYRTYNRQVT